MSKQKVQRGGRRAGAGRKPTYGKRMTPYQITLPDCVVEMLDKLAGNNKTRSAVVLELLGKAHKPISDALKRTAK